ncbi:ferritin family protein [Myxococcota bacterium]|jgi:rubrerythrin|nr:ferritin family protein [Myxococcota bacterium]MBU1412213.1 ferritin family protein [Myxococcota bacterium]MBU1509706.1 ferritin family protein [Myxococcota bacterium]
MSITLEQAIRNAVETERGANRFYTFIAQNTSDPEAKKFLREMAEEEKGHAELIEKLGKKLVEGELPLHADAFVALQETAPGWKFAEGISLVEALQIAAEAEQGAMMYYEMLADYFPEPHKQFFSGLVKAEEKHLSVVDAKLESLAGR